MALEALTVMDPETMREVPSDGSTMGEIASAVTAHCQAAITAIPSPEIRNLESARPAVGLRQNLLRHHARNIGKPEVAPLIAIRESLVINAAEPQHRRVQIMDVHLLTVLHEAIAECVRAAPRHAGLDATTGHPD